MTYVLAVVQSSKKTVPFFEDLPYRYGVMVIVIPARGELPAVVPHPVGAVREPPLPHSASRKPVKFSHFFLDIYSNM